MAQLIAAAAPQWLSHPPKLDISLLRQVLHTAIVERRRHTALRVELRFALGVSLPQPAALFPQQGLARAPGIRSWLHLPPEPVEFVVG